MSDVSTVVTAIATCLVALLQPVVAAVGHDGVLDQKLLMNTTGLYPRIILLPSHGSGGNDTLLASLVTFASSGQGIGRIMRSTDGGRSFSHLADIMDPEAVHGLCCATLYVVPASVHSTIMPPGSILWAGSFGANKKQMSIRLWMSRTHGASWSFVSTIVNTTSQRGLWEPEFFVGHDGALSCYYSDETFYPAHSQVLARRQSKDGFKWDAKSKLIVASPIPFYRPGMANVRSLASNLYIMSYEVCGTGCMVHIRWSRDGVQWGNPADMGTLVLGHQAKKKKGDDATTITETTKASVQWLYFAHTPVLATLGHTKTTSVVDNNNGTCSSFLLFAQMLKLNETDDVAPLSGKSYFQCHVDDGPSELLDCTVHSAPVGFYVSQSSWCPNYSPGVVTFHPNASVVAARTAQIVEISSFYISGEGSPCAPWFGSSAVEY